MSSPARVNSTGSVRRRESTGILLRNKKRRLSTASSLNVEPDTCAVCLDECNLPFKTKECRHVFCYLCLKNTISTCVSGPKCPLCRANIDLHEVLENTTVDVDDFISGLDIEFVWQYSGRAHGFWMFDAVQTEVLETAYQKYVIAKEKAIADKKVVVDGLREKAREERRLANEKKDEEKNKLNNDVSSNSDGNDGGDVDTTGNVDTTTGNDGSTDSGDSVGVSKNDTETEEESNDNDSEVKVGLTSVDDKATTDKDKDTVDKETSSDSTDSTSTSIPVNGDSSTTDGGDGVGDGVSDGVADGVASKLALNDQLDDIENSDFDDEDEEDYDRDSDDEGLLDEDDDSCWDYNVYPTDLNGEHQVTLSIGGVDYIVDFFKMTQYPFSQPNRVRNVRRIPKDNADLGKGVSGVKFIKKRND